MKRAKVKPLRVLICGGRDFKNEEMFQVGMKVLENRQVEAIIHGGATGADRMAGRYAKAKKIPEIAVPADWNLHGRAAGPMRNSFMLEEHAPNLVIAFPGGKGTADMVAKAKAKGVSVLQVGLTEPVRSTRTPGKRPCPHPECTVSVPNSMFMCRTHWFGLPAALRQKIWYTYRPGQEKDGVVSPAYWDAAKSAIEFYVKKLKKDSPV